MQRKALEAAARRPAQSLESEFKTAWRAAWPAFCRLVEVAAALIATYSRDAAIALGNGLFVIAVAVIAKGGPLRSRAVLRIRSYHAHMAERFRDVEVRRRTKRALGAIEAALWIAAVVTLGYGGYEYASTAVYQAHAKAAFHAMSAKHSSPPTVVHAASVAAIATAPAPYQMLGMLEIPRIHLSSVVEQGDDDAVLNRSIGHIPGTALPGSQGNVGLAGHRDSFFRHLGELKRGDEITFRSVSGTYTYRVRATSVVDPTDVGVLLPTGQPTLTLVTCYPFHYIGSAPKRFVLLADETRPSGR